MKKRTLIQIIMVLVVLVGFFVPNKSEAGIRYRLDGTKIVTYEGNKLEVLKKVENLKNRYFKDRRVKAIYLSISQNEYAKAEVNISKGSVAKLTELVQMRTTIAEFKTKEYGFRKQGWQIRKTFNRNYDGCKSYELLVTMKKETPYYSTYY